MNKESTGISKACFAMVMMSVVLILAVDAAVALDIHNINLFVVEYRFGGVPDSDPYEFSCDVSGDDITAVTMTTPGNVVYNLEVWTNAQYNWWGFSRDDLTPAELVAMFPNGDYIFTFNGGTDSVILYHNPTEPTGFANITNPVHYSTGVSLNPTFTWDSCAVYGDALTTAVAEAGEEGDMVEVVYLGDIGMTSWIVGKELNPGLLHWLEVSVITGTTPFDRSTTSSDTFVYHDWFENCSVVYFTTVTTTISVEIDIKPGSYPNSINPKAGGVIPVAILTTADFDASTVDPQTVALEGAGARGKGKSDRYGSMEDVDGDGDLDLVVQVVNEIEWAENATEATLTGETWDGIPIEGSDCIRLVPDDDNNGDQMWVEIEFVPHAQMQTDGYGNIAFYTGFGISLWDDSLYAYNQGARSAIITGPGLPVAGQVLEHYYPEPIFRLYPKGAWGHPSGGWGLWLDDTAISAIPDNAVYTIGIYKETADTVSLSDTPLKSYTKTFAKGPVLNSELNASLFPALLTPSSHDESVLNIPGLVEVSWTNPSNMAVDWTTLGLHSPDWSTSYQISTNVMPGDTSATLDTTSLPLDVRANHLYMHGTDIYERRFGFGWDLFSP